MKAVLENGKYEIEFDESKATLVAKRYGGPWRDLTGDGLMLSMLARIAELEAAANPQPIHTVGAAGLNPSHHPLAQHASELM